MSAQEDNTRELADSRAELTDGNWAVGVSLVVFGTGIVTASPFLIALSVVPLGFVAAAGFDSAPEPTVSLRRELQIAPADGSVVAARDTDDSETLSGDPGQRVTVRLGIRNDGEEPVVDLRINDGVPADIPVVTGEPGGCLTVGVGERKVIEYEVELRRGEHRFGDVDLRTRGPGGTEMRTETQSVAGDDSLACYATVRDIPIDDGANDFAGQIPTDDGGGGVEFHSVREYEPGDAVRSIDWRRYASTRELATVEFRAERATRVVCVLDQRENQHLAPSADQLPALELSVAAARRTFEAVFESNYPAGVAAYHDELLRTIAPGTDETTRQRGLNFLEGIRDEHEESFVNTRKRWGDPASTLPVSLPGEAQVIVFSSFTDDQPSKLVKQLRTQNYPVCVVSPDVAAGRDDAAGRLTALGRQTQLAETREHGARVVDWDTRQPLGVVLSRVVSEVSSR